MNGIETHDYLQSGTGEYLSIIRRTLDRISNAISALGHTTDADVTTVDGVFVGLFVIANGTHLYIGYGANGGRNAYYGEESAILDLEIAMAIVDYVAGLSSNLSLDIGSLVDRGV